MRQNLPLDIKILMTKARIREWYNEYGGDVYVSFSGGKDSTVLLDLVRSCYPEVKAVYIDTGLEYVEVRDFVKTIDNVIWLKPKMNFKQVIQNTDIRSLVKSNLNLLMNTELQNLKN